MSEQNKQTPNTSDDDHQGIILSQFGIENDGKMWHKRTQPTEDIIFERNKRVRNEKPLKDLSFGRQIASIPFNVLEWAIRNGFQLDCPDKDIRQKEMFRFLTTTDEGRACMVQDHI